MVCAAIVTRRLPLRATEPSLSAAFSCLRCSRAGAGPRPVAIERVTERRLVDMLSSMARPEVIQAAEVRLQPDPTMTLRPASCCHFCHHVLPDVISQRMVCTCCQRYLKIDYLGLSTLVHRRWAHA